MSCYINLPGIGGSGPTHWQSLWEQSDAGFTRFRPGDWDSPDLDDWCAALVAAVAAAPAAPILVAHSLACLLVPHAALRGLPPVRGAVLVCVPDPQGENFPAAASSFHQPPRTRLPFPSLIVASSDDPYGGLGHAGARAEDWGAGLVALDGLGHINAASGVADWGEGRRLLAAFTAGLRA